MTPPPDSLASPSTAPSQENQFVDAFDERATLTPAREQILDASRRLKRLAHVLSGVHLAITPDAIQEVQDQVRNRLSCLQTAVSAMMPIRAVRGWPDNSKMLYCIGHADFLREQIEAWMTAESTDRQQGDAFRQALVQLAEAIDTEFNKLGELAGAVAGETGVSMAPEPGSVEARPARTDPACCRADASPVAIDANAVSPTDAFMLARFPLPGNPLGDFLAALHYVRKVALEFAEAHHAADGTKRRTAQRDRSFVWTLTTAAYRGCRGLFTDRERLERLRDAFTAAMFVDGLNETAPAEEVAKRVELLEREREVLVIATGEHMGTDRVQSSNPVQGILPSRDAGSGHASGVVIAHQNPQTPETAAVRVVAPESATAVYRKGPTARRLKSQRRNELIDQAIGAGMTCSKEIFAFVKKEDPKLVLSNKREITIESMMRKHSRERNGPG